jgi:23S rRNA pseudouridine2605 synthase
VAQRNKFWWSRDNRCISAIVSVSKSKEPQRIAKLLARAGVASRRDIERMIAEGRIALDGVTLDTPATLLASLRGVTVDGNPVAAPAPARLFRFHKQNGVLTTERDPKGRTTIYDRLPAGLPRVVPVGRLDLNTEGLLLLTTDGELKRQLELPATGVERSYRARAYGDVSQAQLEELMLGIEIEGVRYGSINANLERRTGANAWIELTLTEGKNREVRRVLEHLGLRVSRLIRTRYGPFHLDDLPEGEVEEVRQHDLITFRNALGQRGGGKIASNLQFAYRPRPVPPAPKPEAAEEPPVNRSARRTAVAKARPDAAKEQPGRAGKPDGRSARPARTYGARPASSANRPERNDADKPARKVDGAAKPRKPVSRTDKESEDRAAFVDRPKRYRPGDRRPRRPAGPKPGPKPGPRR